MKQIFLFPAVFMLSALSVFAQTPPAARIGKERTQKITIRKNASDKEKMVIVIDGDNITVNGKPLKDYKGDIRITENEDFSSDIFPPISPLAPAYPHGGAKSYSNSFSFGNKALLGVYAEGDKAGAKIKSVTKDSPADKAGLKEDDIITKINTENIDESDDLSDIIGKYNPEDKITVTYMRGDKENTVIVTLAKNKQADFSWSNGDKDFMKTFRNLSRIRDDNKAYLGIRVEDTEAGNGVKVTDIDEEEAPGAKAGLHEDDVITQLNGKKVSSVKEAKDALADVKPGDKIPVSYLRKGSAQTATISFPKPLESSDL